MANRMMFTNEEMTLSRTHMLKEIFRNSGRRDVEDEGDHCVVLCQKLMANTFFIKRGLLFIDERQGLAEPETISINCRTRVVFLKGV
ncbi:MAG: hypothetical protein HQL26_06820 [Candidatus Omnitrophica bacterium]|nr:hypothetical protein [Candidatus Omnitrophota bacterium]